MHIILKYDWENIKFIKIINNGFGINRQPKFNFHFQNINKLIIFHVKDNRFNIYN